MIFNEKNNFSFSLGTTSYIYPFEKDNLIKNVEHLADYFDLIQLLYLGKDYLDEVASPEIIKKLAQIQKSKNIDYSVHLPVDLKLLKNIEEADVSVKIIKRIIKAVAPLQISGYVLHLDNTGSGKIESHNKNSFINKLKNILLYLQHELNEYKNQICIESLFYDLTIYKNIILSTDFNICWDIGHSLLMGFDLEFFFTTFKDRIRMIHLHGVENQKDHLSVNKIDKNKLIQIQKYLNLLNQPVIIEVFNEKKLISSLKVLNKF